MSELPDAVDGEPMTLDPPGSIAVIGAGPLGVEAALYGRYLGYDVTLIESVSVGASLEPDRGQPLAMLPDRCLSPLANSALDAQGQMAARVLPMTTGQWIDEGLIALIETDLLAGRLRCPVRVCTIEQMPVDRQDESDPADTDGIPPDFRVASVEPREEPFSIVVEAVIVATGTDCDIDLSFELPAEYFFRIGGSVGSDVSPEASLKAGFAQIVSLYAGLAGRDDLDLYRPRRGGS